MHTNQLLASDLTQTYGDGATATPALQGVSLAIGANGPEAVAIMGPSGSGKSTLLHALAGIITPSSGRVLWRDRDLVRLSDRERTALRRSDFGFVFQQGQLLPELPAVENVALPLMLHGTARGAAQAHAGGLLGQLGLAGMLHRRPGELSGGQAQRVAIARALVGTPGIVFADEPTGALDQATGAQVMALLTQQTLRAGASLVVVTHDPGVAAHCTRVVRLHDGRIVADEPGDGRALRMPPIVVQDARGAGADAPGRVAGADGRGRVANPSADAQGRFASANAHDRFNPAAQPTTASAPAHPAANGRGTGADAHGRVANPVAHGHVAHSGPHHGDAKPAALDHVAHPAALDHAAHPSTANPAAHPASLAPTRAPIPVATPLQTSPEPPVSHSPAYAEWYAQPRGGAR